MRSFFIVLNLILLTGAILWWIIFPGWAPFTTTLAALIAFLRQVYINDNIRDRIKTVFKSNISGDQFIVVNHGMGYEDTKSMMMDLIRANMLDYSDAAKEIVNKRSEEITEKVLQNIRKINKGALEEFKNPGMQDSFFEAQKAYAISGDEDMCDLLVDIVTDRATTPQRNNMQIVLTEAIKIAPKLTLVQLDTLTLMFLLNHNIREDLRTYDEFRDYLVNDVFLFADNLTNESQDFKFMDYLGCVQSRVGRGSSVETLMRVYYPIFFSKGLSQQELNFQSARLRLLNSVGIVPCFHDETRFQLEVFNNRELQVKLNRLGVDRKDINKYMTLFKDTTMSDIEIKAKLNEIGPKMDQIFNKWFRGMIFHFEISSVGIVIAHSNYRRKTQKSLNLSNWIK